MSAPADLDRSPGPEVEGMMVDSRSEAPSGWDGFVADRPESSFAHLSSWGEIFRRALRLDPHFLVARGGGEIRGVLPLVRMPTLRFGYALVSMPYLNYGGPVGSSRARTALLHAAVRTADEWQADLLEVRARDGCGSSLPPGREKVTVVLELPDDPEVLFRDRFASKLRSQIRKPMKEGFEVRFGPEQTEPFHEVFADHMRTLGTPALPLRLFADIVETFPDQVEIGVVYDGDVPVAGGYGFHWKDEFEMTWASSLRSYNRRAPNMLLYWAFMERAILTGRRRFNFGRCTPGGGTHRFKKQWGGTDEPLEWRQWPAAGGPPDATSPLFRMATSVWRRLPRGAADRLAPLAARRIPTY